MGDPLFALSHDSAATTRHLGCHSGELLALRFRPQPVRISPEPPIGYRSLFGLVTLNELDDRFRFARMTKLDLSAQYTRDRLKLTSKYFQVGCIIGTESQ